MLLAVLNSSAVVALLSASFALLGVMLSGLMNRRQQREKLLGIVFDKKVEFYAGLVAHTGSVFQEILVGSDYEKLAHELPQRVKSLQVLVLKNLLFGSEAVLGLVHEFGKTAKTPELILEERMRKLVTIHNDLRKQCCIELGLDRVEGLFKMAEPRFIGALFKKMHERTAKP